VGGGVGRGDLGDKGVWLGVVLVCGVGVWSAV